MVGKRIFRFKGLSKSICGYITVYLSLMLGIIITFITTMLMGICIHTIRFEAECVMDMGMDSIFAEYHREMLNRYGLFFIDSSYGSQVCSKEYTKSHLLRYMNKNFSGKADNLTKNITGIHGDNGELSNISYATDNMGEVLLYQICQYEKDRYFLDMADGALENVDIEKILEEYGSLEAERESAANKVDSIMEEINSGLDEDEDPYSISNPADSVEYLSDSNVLYYAFGDVGQLPLESVILSDYVSKRSISEGTGLRSYQQLPVTHKLILEKYIFENCGYYEHIRDNSRLSYQIEYLLAGKASDLENLEEISETIFKTRYVINMSYLLSNTARQEEALAMATLACTIIGQPELVEAVKYTILFAWGYAESAKDLRILFDGHSLSLTKTDNSWNTPLSQLITFKQHLDIYMVPTGNINYETYLKGFFILKDTKTLTLRLMDVMEMDIRETRGNSYFKMDGQIYQMTASVNISSCLGYGCNIARGYSYE